jgi:HD-like signal output (HDOD) protein
MDGVKPVYFSIEKVWRHGLAVGQWAREIARLESNDTVLAEQAYTAGLLHDIGKIVFVANLNADYDAALKRAHEQHISPVLAEAAIFGASHAQIAAYLTALWGLPRAVVEAIGFHHTPDDSHDEEFSPLTAVYIANLFKNLQICYGHAPGPHPIALGYLSRVGLANRLDFWASHWHVPPAALRPANGNHVEKVSCSAARRPDLASRTLSKWRHVWPF